jgi:hypothetical protein
MMMRPGVLILLVVALARSAVAQQPALVRGRVIADENERPLRGARIAPTNPPPRISAAITDDEGTFELAIAQSAELIVSKAGFATMRIQRRSNAHTDDRPTEIRLSKGAAISGRVADEADIPAIAARVAAVPVDSRPAHPSSYVTQTDDRGEYRIGGLAPGRYTMLVNTLPISLGATDPATAQALGNLRFAPSAEDARGHRSSRRGTRWRRHSAQAGAVHLGDASDACGGRLACSGTVEEPHRGSCEGVDRGPPRRGHCPGDRQTAIQRCSGGWRRRHD